MTEFAFRPGDATWHKWRERAKTDLYWFAGVVCGYGDSDKVGMTVGMHQLLCSVASRTTGVPELDECPMRLLLLPRGIGKTTLITQAYVLQRICNDPNTAILICNEKLENAQTFLSAIKWQFEQNELFRALFPELIHQDYNAVKWNESEINVAARKTGRKEPTIKCQGAGAALASMHVDLIVVDDEISREAAENARRGDGGITGAMVRWNAQLVPLLNPGYRPFSEIIWIGTRWYRGDPYEALETQFGYGEEKKTWDLGVQLPSGEIQSVPVHRKGDLVIFTRQVVENGRAVWPEREGYSIEALAKKRLTDPELFAANMMNSPSDEITATFKESWLQMYDWAGEQQVQFVDHEAKVRTYALNDLDIQMFVDPGGFSTRKGSDRSRGAIIVTGTTPGDTPSHLILEAFSDRVAYTQVQDKILSLQTRYPVRKVWIEVVGQQVTFFDQVRQKMTQAGCTAMLDKLEPKNERKDNRILALEPFFQRGVIRVGKGPGLHEFREQYRSWPAPRADLLDVLAYASTKWRQPKLQGQTQTARQQAEREAYLRRRGMGGDGGGLSLPR